MYCEIRVDPKESLVLSSEVPNYSLITVEFIRRLFVLLKRVKTKIVIYNLFVWKHTFLSSFKIQNFKNFLKNVLHLIFCT